VPGSGERRARSEDPSARSQSSTTPCTSRKNLRFTGGRHARGLRSVDSTCECTHGSRRGGRASRGGSTRRGHEQVALLSSMSAVKSSGLSPLPPGRNQGICLGQILGVPSCAPLGWNVCPVSSWEERAQIQGIPRSDPWAYLLVHPLDGHLAVQQLAVDARPRGPVLRHDSAALVLEVVQWRAAAPVRPRCRPRGLLPPQPAPYPQHSTA